MHVALRNPPISTTEAPETPNLLTLHILLPDGLRLTRRPGVHRSYPQLSPGDATPGRERKEAGPDWQQIPAVGRGSDVELG